MQLIENIRSSPPSRRVQGGRGNVSGNYPSQKMGVTIQFESHKCELARIYELEHDADILEYYDQPPPIELSYEAKSGRRNRHCYTPDFFVIRSVSAGWEECKPTEALKPLSEKSPNRYSLDDSQRWRCPPAEEYAARFGLSFNVWTDAAVNWIFQSNCIWLEDYLHSENLLIEEQSTAKVLSVLEQQSSITLSELLQIGVKADDIYALIATQKIYVDHNLCRLSQSCRIKVY
ncbi:MAG: heteromeric transposase endonuclease subunit TnsA, partial [Bacteroidota bacterium]